MAIFRRSWRVTIELKDRYKVFSELATKDMSLKIDFDVINKMGSNSWSEGTITLQNLKRDDIYYLASSVMLGQGRTEIVKNAIKLEAGYNGDLAIIGNGNIWGVEADFTSPDNKINITFKGGLSDNFINAGAAISLKGDVDLKDICKELTTMQKLQLQYDDSIKPLLSKGFSFVGTPLQLLKQLQTSFKDLYFYIGADNKILYVKPRSGGTIKNPQVFSEETGLQGTPKPTQYGLMAISVLNPALKAGEWITLNSKRVTQYNGNYFIREIKHKGGNQSNEWASVLDLTKSAMGKA